MIETLELEESVVVPCYDAPRLLVEWSSPWHEFVTSVRPALVRSERRLAGEAPFGLIPLRVMIPSFVLEAFLIFAAVVVQVKIAQLQPFVAPRFSSHDVIYYSGEELPRTEDLSGSQAGTSGRAGGGEARHRMQTNKIARGGSLVPTVVDAPNLKLPSSRDAVANLLAIKPNPGPPPSQGLRSTRTPPSLVTALVAPAPAVTRDSTRSGVQLESVIAPAPSVPREQARLAPNLSATLIAPAARVADDHARVAPAAVPAFIPPAPSVSRDHTSFTPSFRPALVAPAPRVARDRARSAPALAANVIPAAPGTVNREFSARPVQMNAAVVPPPVSAPERATARNSKLNLPAPSVIAPPNDLSPDIHRLAGGYIPDSSKSVVPPPPAQTGSGSFMSSLMGKLFGTTEVVPPPPSVHSNPSGSGTGSLRATVVPPPPNVAQGTEDDPSHGTRQGIGAMLRPNVIAPPPSTGASGGTGTRSLSSSSASSSSAPSSSAPSLGALSVVAPPPSLSGTGRTGVAGTSLANNIVPPPPSVGRGTGTSGSGFGRNAANLGALSDSGLSPAPPATASSGTNAGAVLSSQPGSKVGLPSTGGTGSLAMSPTGGDKPGLGGSGGGTSIGHGNGPGSGMNGARSGAAKVVEAGRGSDANAHSGISSTPGPGGAGNIPSGTPPVRGVDISGGTGVVNIPSFGSDSSLNGPNAPGRSTLKDRQGLGVTIVATASSGGAFEPYKKLLRGEQYTTYFDTSLGTVVMEFADESATGHPFGGALTAPGAMRTELAAGLPRSRMVVACTLDASGNVKNLRVLESGPAEVTAKLVSSLRSWKFQPAMRGNQPVEVTVIFGFGIDTNDRF